MTLEKQIEILKEWKEGAQMSLPIMSEEDIARFLEWLEDYKRLKDEMIPAYDEQLTEAQCKVIQQMREMKKIKADCFDLENKLRMARVNQIYSAEWLQIGTDIYECSNCNAKLYGATVEKLVDTEHFCYSCGSKMEVDHDEN